MSAGDNLNSDQFGGQGSKRVSPKVYSAIETHHANLRRMRDAVRRSYQEGRWAVATPEARAATRRNFRIEQARLRKLTDWLSEREQQ